MNVHSSILKLITIWNCHSSCRSYQEGEGIDRYYPLGEYIKSDDCEAFTRLLFTVIPRRELAFSQHWPRCLTNAHHTAVPARRGNLQGLEPDVPLAPSMASRGCSCASWGAALSPPGCWRQAAAAGRVCSQSNPVKLLGQDGGKGREGNTTPAPPTLWVPGASAEAALTRSPRGAPAARIYLLMPSLV